MKNLPKNISQSQADLRFVLWCILVVLSIFYHGWLLPVLGLIFIITGHKQYCPPCSYIKIPGVCDLKEKK